MTSRQDEQRQQKLIAEFEELKETLRRTQERREFEPLADPHVAGVAEDRWEPYVSAAPVVARPSEPRGPEAFARADFVEPLLRARRPAPQEPQPPSDDVYAFHDIDPRRERETNARPVDAPSVSAAKRLGVPDAAELVPIRSSFPPGKDIATLSPPPQEGSPRNWWPIVGLIALIAIVGLGLAFRDDWKGHKLEAETTQASAPDQPALADRQDPEEPTLGAEDKAAADALIKDQSSAPETAQAPAESRQKGAQEQTATIAPAAAPEARPQEISPAPPPAAAPSDLTQPPATAPVGRFTPTKQAPAQTAQPPAEPAKPKPAPKAAERPRPPQAAKPIKVIAAPPAAEAKTRPERIVVPPLPSEALPPPPPPAAAAQPPSGGVDPLGFVKRTFNSVTGTVTSWSREVIGQP